jgi:hypothetical protein
MAWLDVRNKLRYWGSSKFKMNFELKFRELKAARIF